jgi:hypothetical protein
MHSHKKKGPSDGDVRPDQMKHKGQELQSDQKGAPAMNKQDTGKHKKDNSDGDDKNTTKRQENSV